MSERRAAGGRCEIRRPDEFADELLRALPESRTGITTEAKAWRYAVSRYLADHRDDFLD